MSSDFFDEEVRLVAVSPDDPSMMDDDSSGKSAESRPRGLWELMRGAAASTEPPSQSSAAEGPGDAAPPEKTSGPGGRSLWEVMKIAPVPVDASPPAEAIAEASPMDESTGDESAGATDIASADLPVAESATAEDVPGDRIAEALVSPIATIRQSASQRRPSGQGPLVLGGTSLILTGLAALPGLFVSLPSALLAFGAAGWASVVLTQARVPSQARWQAGLGGLLGIVALFLAPLVLAPWGDTMRREQIIARSQQTLAGIGTALNAYHQEQGTYPVGGTFLTEQGGARRGGHGWMTALLPYIGEQGLAATIDLTKPYDDPANRAALGTFVEAYLSADGPRERIPPGLAVAHFAGVGGTTRTRAGDDVPAGVFAVGRPIRQDDLTRGLSQTLVAGEIGRRYPAWGEPENWRGVGKGLNVDPKGFGNPSGTGALLLFADGSVRFFPNGTDRQLLLDLSCRGNP